MFSCTQCTNSLANKMDLQRQFKVHSVDTTFVCSLCTTIFWDSQQFQWHLRVHTIKKPPYLPSLYEVIFPIISFMFTFKSSQVRETNCVLPVYKKLRRVLRLADTCRSSYKEKSFVCSLCTKIFIDSYNLQRHFRVYTGETPFSSSQSTKSFAN